MGGTEGVRRCTPHKVMVPGGAAHSGMGALLKDPLYTAGTLVALTKFGERDVTVCVCGGGTQGWESTQPACSLGTELLYYLFTYCLRCTELS